MAEENNDTPEMSLDEIVEVAPDELSDEQKTFLQENSDNLTDEQKEKFGIESEEEPNPDEIEPEVRGGPKEEVPPEEEEDDEIDPEDEKTIGKVVKKQLADVTSQLSEVQKLKDEAEVTAFIQSKPEYGKYRGVILKYLAHPTYKNIPVHNIAAMVAAKDLQKLGAQKEREAAQKVKETQGGGSTARKAGGETDWSKVSKEEFEAQKAKVLGQET